MRERTGEEGQAPWKKSISVCICLCVKYLAEKYQVVKYLAGRYPDGGGLGEP